MTTYHKGTTRKTSIYNEEKQTENNCDMCHNKTDVLFLNIEWDSNTRHALTFFSIFVCLQDMSCSYYLSKDNDPKLLDRQVCANSEDPD